VKLGLSLSGINQTIKNLESVGFLLQTDFKSELIQQGKSLRDKAKEILADESQRETGQKYWTGKLQDSIQMKINQETGQMVGISVGPDMRTAPYAEYIEVGHFIHGGFYGTKGNWWEGYHYMEKAYIEMKDEIPAKIAETLKVSLNRFARSASKRTVHKTTRRFVKGWAGYN